MRSSTKRKHKKESNRDFEVEENNDCTEKFNREHQKQTGPQRRKTQ